MDKISIIISEYNSEKTISRCLDSLINQTYKDIEIIVVNDGSTDNSYAVTESYAKKDGRIILFNNSNHGPSFSRNFGINKATGKYIAFVDSDDYLDKDAIEFMYNSAQKSKADILLCGYFKETGDSTFKITADSGIFSGKEINSRLVELKSKDIIDPLWNKLYRSDFLRETGVLMPENELYEDTDFNLRLLSHNPVIEICDRCFYHYVLHLGSITRRFNPEKLDLIKKRARLLKEVSSGLDSYCDFYFIKCIFSSVIDSFFSCSKNEILSVIKKEIAEEEFDKKSKNADFSGISSKIIIFIARTKNSYLIYTFCKLCFYFKYKFQKLFMKVR